MPKITLMPEGINAAYAGGNASPERRGVIRGLSAGSARRQQQRLMSIDVTKLTGSPVSFTLTVRDVPASAEEWGKAKKAFLRHLRRYGVLRVHWCLEWTKRGRPHLHGIAFFPSHRGQPGRLLELDGQRSWEVLTPFVMVEWWRSVAAQWGVSAKGQYVSIRETTETAWFRYMAKHASRGVGHYQRQEEVIPEAWKKTGRMWGTVGDDWPLYAEKHDLPTWMFHRLRRQVRALTRSRALRHIQKGETHGNPVQVAQGKATLRYLRRLSGISDPIRSARWPISEWVPGQLVELMLSGIATAFEPPQEPHQLDVREAQIRDGAWNPAHPDQDEPLAGPDPSWGDLPY